MNAFSGNLEVMIFKIALSGQTMVGPRGVTELLPPPPKNKIASYHPPNNSLATADELFECV